MSATPGPHGGAARVFASAQPVASGIRGGYHARVIAPSRLATLESVVAKRARDPFAQYGLAMEYLKLGRLDDALARFEKTLELDPHYTPAYYHAARGLFAASRRGEAEAMVTRGLRACEEKPDAHTAEELRALLANS